MSDNLDKDSIMEMIGSLLDERDKKQKEAKDPQLRFNNNMERFEKILDRLDEGSESKPARKRSPKKESERSLVDLFTGTNDD